MDFTAVFIAFIAVGLPIVAATASLAMLLTYSLRRRELKIRELEATARLASAQQLPDWLDTRDADAIAEYKLAQRELDRVAARAALSRGRA